MTQPSATCKHTSASVHRSTIVDSPTGRKMRAYCPDCNHFVETVPRVERRTNRVFATGWVVLDGKTSGAGLDQQ